MRVLVRVFKQPSEILDYDVDYTQWFSNRSDTPASFTATADTGITIVSSSRTGNVVKVILSGGTNGQTYKITVRLTTSSGIVKEADFAVRVRET